MHIILLFIFLFVLLLLSLLLLLLLLMLCYYVFFFVFWSVYLYIVSNNNNAFVTVLDLKLKDCHRMLNGVRVISPYLYNMYEYKYEYIYHAISLILYLCHMSFFLLLIFQYHSYFVIGHRNLRIAYIRRPPELFASHRTLIIHNSNHVKL